MKKLKCLGSYIRSRLPILLLAICIISCAIASTVYAKYVKTLDKDITLDIIAQGDVHIEVIESGGGVYQIKNNSSIPVFVRFAVTANWANDTSELFYIQPTAYTINPEECTTLDYYYYNKAIPAGATVNVVTVALKPEAVAPAEYPNFYVQILAEAIQCEPSKAVETAWGVTFNGTTWTTAP